VVSISSELVAGALVTAGPSSQLNRFVLSKIKWITIASANKNAASSTNDRLGSKICHILHIAI
jgi:hypothetical protein